MQWSGTNPTLRKETDLIEPSKLEAAIDVAEIMFAAALEKRVAAIKAEAEALAAEADAEAARRYVESVAAEADEADKVASEARLAQMWKEDTFYR